MRLKTKTYNLELSPSDIEILEEELFKLHLWDNDRNSPLNKHKIQKGDFTHLEELFNMLQQVKNLRSIEPKLSLVKSQKTKSEVIKDFEKESDYVKQHQKRAFGRSY